MKDKEQKLFNLLKKQADLWQKITKDMTSKEIKDLRALLKTERDFTKMMKRW